MLIKDLQGTALIYDQQGDLTSAIRIGQSVAIDGINVKLINIIGSTGLQIKADPGVPIVYTGFALLMMGVVMSYFSHSQIWALEQDNKFYFGAKTNRAQVSFEREILGVIDSLNDETESVNISESNKALV